MISDTLLLILAWGITSVLLLLYVPKEKIRESFVIFMFKQLMTWLIGLVVAELKLLEYPIRSFAYATKASFDFEYFFYPSFCVLFNLYYPEGKRISQQILYYFYYCTVLTMIEVLVEKYTNILEYLNWTWYITYISFAITFYLSHLFYRWFFKIDNNN